MSERASLCSGLEVSTSSLQGAGGEGVMRWMGGWMGGWVNDRTGRDIYLEPWSFGVQRQGV